MPSDFTDTHSLPLGPASPHDLIRRWLAEALSIAEGEEREAFLVGLEKDHPEQAKEVRSLVQWGQEMQPFLTPGEPEAGTLLGGYELKSVLGEGGFGTVWRARAREVDLRDVALKIVKAGQDTEAVLRRFERERDALARLDHPGVAAITDGGRTQTGRPFIVMKMVLGKPITEFTAEHGLDHREVAQLMVRVCRGVEHAHGKHVLHQDLKPSNILVEEVDGTALPTVIDFGIAAVLSDDPESAPTLILDGRPVGSPEYMSPEQAMFRDLRPASDRFDGRTDVFALGRILFKLVTGQASEDFGTADDLKLRRLMDEAFERGPRSPRKVARALGERAVDRNLDAIVQHATETEPARRYASVAELREDLERFLRGDSVTARPPGALERARRFGRRHRPVLVPAAVLVAALGTSLVYVTGAQSRTAQANERLTQTVAVQSELMGQFEVEAMGGDMRKNLLGQLGAALVDDPERDAVLSGVVEHVNFTDLARGVVERNVLEPAEAALEARFSDNLSARKVLSKKILDVRKRDGLFEGRGRTAAGLHEMALEAYGEGSVEAAETVMQMGRASLQRGLSDDAKEHFAHSLEMYSELLGPESQEALLARQYLSRIDLHQRDHVKALAGLSEVLAGAESAGITDGILMESTWMLVGKCHEAARIFGLALEAFRKAEALVSARADTDDFRRLEPKISIARVQAARGQTEEALRLLEEILPEVRESFGETHQHTVLVLSALADARYQAGDLPGALAAIELVHAAQVERLTAAHPVTLATMANRLQILNVLGRYDDADAMGKEAVDSASGSIPPDSETMGAILMQRATTLAGLARLDEAMEALEASLQVFEACLPLGHARRQMGYQLALQMYSAVQGMRPDEDYSGLISKYQAKAQAPAK